MFKRQEVQEGCTECTAMWSQKRRLWMKLFLKHNYISGQNTVKQISVHRTLEYMYIVQQNVLSAIFNVL